MKKLAICCLVLAVAAIFVPVSQAAPRCITFTNFCDQIQYDTAAVGGINGTILWGNWDWLCNFEASANVAGNGGAKLKLGTRPYSAVYAYLSPYSFGFAFAKSSHLFGLQGNNGGLNGGGAFVVQDNQPWTQATGSCGFTLKTHKNNGKPRLTAR
jgi:hypothetical protein